MKAIIMDLIKKYYSLGQTVKDTVIIGQGAKAMVRMLVNRTAIAWDITDRDGEYDDTLTELLLEKERNRIAEQLYGMTEDILISLSKSDKWYAIDTRHNITDHRTRMSWCMRALIWLEVINPYDVMYLSAMETEGDTYGYKREAETQEDETTQAHKELQEAEE